MVLNVKAAYFVQYTHTAESLITFYATGKRFIIFPNAFLWKVPSRAATITIFP